MFDYIYGDQNRKFNFIRLPQVLLNDVRFYRLSSDAKILYALMLDRTTLSIKRHWIDSENRVFINFPRVEITEKLCIGNQKAGNILRELERFGLIERIRVGLGNPDRIYVKHCTRELDNEETTDSDSSVECVGTVEKQSVENAPEGENSAFQKAENHHSGDVKISPAEVQESSFPLYNSQTNIARLNQSDHINPDSRLNERIDYVAQREVYEEIIKENIEYDWFISAFELPLNDPYRPHGSKEELDNIVGIMLDCVCSNSEKIRVNGSEQYTAVVRSQFLKLNNEHIQYVLECINNCDSAVQNIRAYLITVLYNAPLTMDTAFGFQFRSTYRN